MKTYKLYYLFLFGVLNVLLINCSKPALDPESIGNSQQEVPLESVKFSGEEFLTFHEYAGSEMEIPELYRKTGASHDGFMWRVEYHSELTITRSTDGKTWLPVAHNMPEGYFPGSPEMVSFRDELWLMGYQEFSGSVVKLFRSRNGSEWQSVSVPVSRLNEVIKIFVFKNRLYILTINNNLLYSSDGEKWIGVTYFFPPEIKDVPIIEHENTLYAFIAAKRNPSTRRHELVNELWFSEDGQNWSVSDDPLPFPEPLRQYTVTSYKDRVWLVGGYTNLDVFVTSTNGIYFSENMREWHKYDGHIPFPRVGRAFSLVFQNKLWLIAGELDPWRFSATIAMEAR